MNTKVFSCSMCGPNPCVIVVTAENREGIYTPESCPFIKNKNNNAVWVSLEDVRGIKK